MQLPLINYTNYKPKLQQNATTLLYREIKVDFCVEYYVLRMYDKRNRSLIARMRADVEIKRGDGGGTPRTERICKLCFNGVEHEVHFLFYCDNFNLFALHMTTYLFIYL